MIWNENRDYGFRDPITAERRYAVTSDYDDIARNHCAATMLTNLVIACGDGVSTGPDYRSLFCEIHKAVGNGPVLDISRRANRYFRARGLPYTCRQTNRHLMETRSDCLVMAARDALRTGYPCALLVAASPLRWHWVLALSMGVASDGTTRFHIVDGWHSRQIYQYIPDRGSRLLAVAAFRG